MNARWLVVMAAVPAAALAYYNFAPLDPLASFDQAREATPHAVRADFHLGYGRAGSYFDADGAVQGLDEANTFFLGVARVGWTFDRTWEADLVIPGVNVHNRVAGADDFASGLGDVWLAGKAVWYTKEGGEFRMGPRLAFRFPSAEGGPIGDKNMGIDVAAIGYWEMRGRHFRLDAQLGLRHDGDSDHFRETPGMSLYLLADPAWALDEEERWIAGASVGGYAGAGTVQTDLLWLGPRLQYVIDENVRLEAGFLFPLMGTSYAIDGFAYNVPRYATGYLGVQSVIPTPW